jgi:Fe-S cluster biogenesis protein NfuA
MAKTTAQSGKGPTRNTTGPGRDASLRDQVQHVLNLIRPAVQSDGGDVELVDVTKDGVVVVRFHGACVGCPSSVMTLQSGIERNLKNRIPSVTAVHTAT